MKIACPYDGCSTCNRPQKLAQLAVLGMSGARLLLDMGYAPFSMGGEETLWNVLSQIAADCELFCERHGMTDADQRAVMDARDVYEILSAEAR